MKLLLDQNVSAGAADLLRARGFDVFHAREMNLSEAKDVEILDWSRAAGRAIISLDGDFHALLALSGARAPSVIRIRIEGLGDAEMDALITHVVGVIREDLSRGCVASVNETSIRVRALPLSTPAL